MKRNSIILSTLAGVIFGLITLNVESYGDVDPCEPVNDNCPGSCQNLQIKKCVNGMIPGSKTGQDCAQDNTGQGCCVIYKHKFRCKRRAEDGYSTCPIKDDYIECAYFLGAMLTCINGKCVVPEPPPPPGG